MFRNGHFKLGEVYVSVAIVNLSTYFLRCFIEEIHSFSELPLSNDSCTFKLIRITWSSAIAQFIFPATGTVVEIAR
uniref:Ceramidase n=1 Tax=Rhizophora mucronata TaxID=61149 RepID=A0A2P2M110_RHIMU